jgi:hypothetical protein
MTGAKARSVQLWADGGVIRAEKSTNRAGSGTHRRFSRDEAIVACIIAPFAQQKIAIGGLLTLSGNVRRMIQSNKKILRNVDFIEKAIKGIGRHFVIVHCDDKTGKIMGTHWIPDEVVSDIRFLKALQWMDQDERVAYVVSLNACLRKLDAQ